MTPDLQRRIQRYDWDQAAPYYETGWQEQLWSAQESLLSEVDPKPGEKILDISCGTGLVTMPVAEIVQPGGSVTGVDLSQGMIEKARSRLKNDGITNVRFHRMDAEAFDLADNVFDGVICSLGLMYFPNPDLALKEMFRVLAPGGRAGALVWGERSKCGWAGIFPITDRRVQSDVGPLFFHPGTGDTLWQAYRQVGFVGVKSNRFSYDLRFRDDKQACTAAFLGGAVALAYQKFDEQTKKEVCREYLESIQQYRDERSYDVPGEFVITKGMKT